MRDRLIDVGLIVLLVVVATAIGFTLLTLNRDPAARPATTGAASAGPRTSGTADDGAAGDASITALPPTQTGAAPEPTATTAAAQTADGTDAADDDTTETAADPEPDPEPAPLRPVPDGAVAIERIGFSFVTGGAGACGIVLEPWRHVAVSRELLAAYGCGAEVTLRLDETKDGRDTVQAVVADTMNPSFSRTVNVYVGQDEPALQYGVTTGVLEP